MFIHTCVDEASRCPFAELFGFVGQRDLHYPGDVSGWRLHTNGMGGDQLRRVRRGKEINAVKLHIQTCSGDSTWLALDLFLCSF